MKKDEQIKINEKVLKALTLLYTDDIGKGKVRLNKCKAYVEETESYYLLFSYNTFVAFISKSEQICYDILRLVYGYTSTSAQHIAKFRKAYGAVDTLTYRPVKGASHD